MKRLLLILALLCTSSLAFGQTVIVPSTPGCLAYNNTGCTVTLNVTAGQNACMLVNVLPTTATPSVITTDGDVFTNAGSGKITSGSYAYELFCGTFNTTNASEIVTAQSTASSNGVGAILLGASGGYTTVDKYNAAASTSSGSTGTLSASTEIAFGFAGAGSGTPTCSTTGGWTVEATYTANSPKMCATAQITSSTTALSQSATGASATFVVTLQKLTPVVATPTFSPSTTNIGITSASIATVTSGAAICYTLNSSGNPTAATAGTCDATDSVGNTEYTYSTAFNPGSNVTVKAIGTLSGDTNSAVGSIYYNPPDQPIVGYGSTVAETFSEFFNPVLNIDSINATPTQLPLDTDWTGRTISSTLVSSWEGMGTSTGNYSYPDVDYALGSYGVRGPAGAFGYATYTGVTIPANQYSSMYYHGGGGSGVGISVGTNCAPGTSFSGNVLQVTSAASDNVSLYINGTLSTTITLTPTDGDLYEMRQYGTTCVPLKNGAQVTGLSASYSCTAATNSVCQGAAGGSLATNPITATTQASTTSVIINFSANPFQTVGESVYVSGMTTATWLNGQTLVVTSALPLSFNANFSHATYAYTSDTGTATLTNALLNPSLTSAVGYNWSGGAIATTNPGVYPISWGGNTYTNYASGTITSGTTLTYPAWMPDGLSGSSYPNTGLINGNWNNALSSQYALGSPGNPSSKIEQAHLLAPFQNLYWFHQFVTMDSTAWNNGNYFLKFASEPYNPPSATTTSISGCYDAGSGYIGTEPMMQGATGCGVSVEYCNTHKLHVTYANNLTASIANTTVNMSGSGVSSVTVTAPRCLSTSTATVYFWGGVGSGATGTANLTTVGCASGYKLSSVTVTNAGSYTTPPLVTVVPGSGGSQACLAVDNYEIATAIGFETSVMHGDEVLGVYNTSTGNLSVYLKGGSAIGGWTASTAVTPRVNALISGVTGTTIQAAGLYQVAITDLFQESFPYVLNQYVFDGTNWQQVTTAGTSATVTPTWNGVLSGTTTSAGATFTNRGPHPSLGTCTDPCTATTAPPVWGGQFNTCETTTTSGALTPDNTATWQCVGEAATNDTAFQLLGSANVPGFNDGQFKFPGIWANNDSTGAGEYAFQDIEFGSGNPCTNGKYTCAGGYVLPFLGWMQ